MHHLNEFNLREAFRQIDGQKAVGIDQVTKSEYGRNLQNNLEALSSEIARGGWRPRPSRQVLIPKPQGGKRPLAIGCLEDKVVQMVTAKMIIVDLTNGLGTVLKRKLKSRMRKSRTSGSVRSNGRQRPLFT